MLAIMWHIQTFKFRSFIDLLFPICMVDSIDSHASSQSFSQRCPSLQFISQKNGPRHQHQHIPGSLCLLLFVRALPHQSSERLPSLNEAAPSATLHQQQEACDADDGHGRRCTTQYIFITHVHFFLAVARRCMGLRAEKRGGRV